MREISGRAFEVSFSMRNGGGFVDTFVVFAESVREAAALAEEFANERNVAFALEGAGKDPIAHKSITLVDVRSAYYTILVGDDDVKHEKQP